MTNKRNINEFDIEIATNIQHYRKKFGNVYYEYIAKTLLL